MSNSPVGVGVIGLGIIGRRMLDQTSDRADISVVSAWDISHDAREICRRDYKNLNLLDNALAVISDPAVDVVYIGTPPEFHRFYFELSLAHGKKIFCEKPLAVLLSDGEAMVEQDQAVGSPNGVNFVFANSPSIDKLTELLNSGAVGQVQSVQIQLFFQQWPRAWQVEAEWLKLAAAGGFVREVLSHYIYLTQRLLGPCEIIHHAVRWQSDPALCERALIASLAAGDIPIDIVAGSGGAQPDTVEFLIRGDQGSVKLSDWLNVSYSDGANWQAVALDLPDSCDARKGMYQAQLSALIELAKNEKNRLATFEQALSVQQIIETLLARG